MENITIYTDTENRVWMYQDEKETRTEHQVDELPEIESRETNPNLYDGYHIYTDGLFTFGYELNVNKCYAEIKNIQAKLNRTSYLDEKEFEGCDMSQYGDWKAEKVAWRDKINVIENLIKL